MIDGFIESTYDPEGKQVVSTDTLQQALAELKDQLELIIKEIEFVIGGTENIQVTENPEALTDSTASKYIVEVEGTNGEKTQLTIKANCYRFFGLEIQKQPHIDRAKEKKNYDLFQHCVSEIDRLGYENLPFEDYVAWIKSVKEEIQRVDLQKKHGMKKTRNYHSLYTKPA